MTDLDYLKKYYKGNVDDAINKLEAGEPVYCWGCRFLWI